MIIPLLFRCPLSLDIFTGQMYDRPCIKRWLAGGHRTCSVTTRLLGDAVLVPNRTLHAQWGIDRKDYTLLLRVLVCYCIFKL